MGPRLASSVLKTLRDPLTHSHSFTLVGNAHLNQKWDQTHHHTSDTTGPQKGARPYGGRTTKKEEGSMSMEIHFALFLRPRKQGRRGPGDNRGETGRRGGMVIPGPPPRCQREGTLTFPGENHHGWRGEVPREAFSSSHGCFHHGLGGGGGCRRYGVTSGS